MKWVHSLIEKLNDPEISSSLLPLLVVSFILFSGFLFFFVKMLKLFGWKFPRLGAWSLSTGRTEKKVSIQKDSVIINLDQKLRGFLKRIFVFSSQAEMKHHHDLMDQLDLERKKITRLEQENARVREQYAKALFKITEFETENNSLKSKHTVDSKEHHAVIQMRDKLQNKVQQLQIHLTELLREVEGLYRENSKTIDLHGIKGRLGTMFREFQDSTPESKGTPTLSPSQLLSDKDAEINRLRSLLMVCKKRMVEMGNQFPDEEAFKEK